MKKRKKLSVKERIELEFRFLSSILYRANYEDVRERAAGFNISWRSFRDRRHKALWRAFEKLNLRSIDERMDIITEELYAGEAGKIKLNPALDPGPEMDMAKGMPGSAQSKEFVKKLQEGSAGVIWLERELEAAGMLPLAGGKTYIRKLAEEGDGEFPPEELYKELFGGGSDWPGMYGTTCCYDEYNQYSKFKDAYGWCVGCEKCNKKTGYYKTWEDARDAWNKIMRG